MRLIIEYITFHLCLAVTTTLILVGTIGGGFAIAAGYYVWGISGVVIGMLTAVYWRVFRNVVMFFLFGGHGKQSDTCWVMVLPVPHCNALLGPPGEVLQTLRGVDHIDVVPYPYGSLLYIAPDLENPVTLKKVWWQLQTVVFKQMP